MLCENAGGQGFRQTSHSISQIIDIRHLMECCSKWHVVSIDDRSAIGDPHDVRNVMDSATWTSTSQESSELI
jgi:hypothetical protein